MLPLTHRGREVVAKTGKLRPIQCEMCQRNHIAEDGTPALCEEIGEAEDGHAGPLCSCLCDGLKAKIRSVLPPYRLCDSHGDHALSVCTHAICKKLPGGIHWYCNRLVTRPHVG